MGKHRSGHSYQEFPILNVARRCGLVLNDRTLEWEEVEASCPFCGDHGPGKHHLFLNTTRNIFRCVLCGEKGNSVSLYAKMEGVSNRQAFRALSEDSVLYRFPQQPLSQKPAEREPSSLAVRHNVYYDMLMHLELSPKHKADLLARGLSEERIEQNMYRTLPMSSSARRFLAGILSDFHNLEGVPGFYVDRGYWNILGHSGLLVPCRDRNGYIQGLQIRLDDETKPDRKYRWLSSRGKAHGTRSYSYIHVTGNIIAFRPHTLWLELALVGLLLLLMAAHGKYSMAVKWAVGYCALLLFQQYILPASPKIIATSFTIFTTYARRMFPCLMTGSLMLKCTPLRYFIVGLRQLRVPQRLIVAVSVTLRYFPAIREEMGYIRDAMKLRDVRGLARLEGTVIPLMVSATETAEELSAAAVTRGIEDPAPKTSAVFLRLSPVDLAGMAAGLVLLALSFVVQ